MGDWLLLLLAGTATAVATGIGAVPVFLLGSRVAAWRPLLWGVAAGLMTVASVVGLLVPGLRDGTVGEVAGGAAAGVAFLVVTRSRLNRRDVHVGRLRGAGVRSSILVFAVLFVHSFPEGFAIGTAYGSERHGLGLYVILAIALQNVPEGTSVAIPMEASGFSPSAQLWSAVATSAPQPVGAVIAFALVEQVRALLPVSFGFAAGAMLALVAVELLPAALTRRTWREAMAGAAAGAATMGALSVALAV
jgi:ZIP family zinc transporter